jgi:Ras-related protein Rab-1A
MSSYTVTGSQPEKFDHIFKVCILGDAGVGKSNLVLRFADDAYTESYISTIGVDFKIKTLDFGDKTIKLQIWDTPGFGSHRDPLDHRWHQGSRAYMVTFALTDRDSFENVTRYLKSIERFAIPNANIMVVGCQVDLVAKRAISFEEAKAFCNARRLPYIETSAKENTNVEEAFTSLASRCLGWSETQIRDREAIITTARVAAESANERRLALIEEIGTRRAELEREDPLHKKAIKIAKIHELGELRRRLLEVPEGKDFAEVVHSFRTAHSILDKGFFSHRTRDLLNKYDPQGPA